ncbi:hypothetical protein SJI00_20980 [Pseudomonas sp. RP23018S]|uniref:hypothetical protein n=1 Tax=Pseudomonas sp. RP23018S TaxID=3096037 RepID=UPI002ACA4C86|nr:hypothetical protein [Pseudomonas sp. RP23018S]MDZ5605251.1 hypothetical protein [Pseudomonas sp. RP23018S]
MTTHTYSSGLIFQIVIEPVARIRGTSSGSAVHARLVEAFSLGAFARLAGQLLCGASNHGVEPLQKSIEEVSCASCRKLLARWSRAELHARFAGYALFTDAGTHAVAALSASMASTLLGVSVGVLTRRGVTNIDLSAKCTDDLAHIRQALRVESFGTVILQTVGEKVWQRMKGPDQAEQILRQQVSAFARRGARPVKQAALQRNRTIRLALDEADALRTLGGAAWLRQRINRAKRGLDSTELEPATVITTIRTTDDQWEKVRAFGGYNWLRVIIRREIQRGRK